MAATDQTLNVKLTGDASDLNKATTDAARSLESLNKTIDKVDANNAEVTVDLQMDRLNRDIAGLNRILAGIERRKANPDVGLDLTKLLQEEKRVQAALDRLEKSKATITVDIDQDISQTIASSSTFTTEMTSLGQAAATIVSAGFGAGLAQSMGQAMTQAFPGIQKRFTGVAQGLGELSQTFRGHATETAAIGKAYRDVVVHLDSFNTALDKGDAPAATIELDRHADAVDAAARAYDDLVAESGNTATSIGYVAAAFARARSNGEGFFRSIGVARSSLKGVSGPMMDLGDDAEDFGVDVGTAALGLRTFTPALSGLGGAAASAAVPLAAVVIPLTALVGIGTKLGLMAADVETLRLQLDTLTGGGGGPLLGDLQEFAAATPFALDEVTAAAKRLIVAGEDLDTLPETMTELGDTAAATGVPLSEIATVFAQMASKGKISAEEMQQLAERGVPAWQALADSMGISVAELQKLSSEGKLGADAIRELQTALGEEFGGAMELQARSLNGQISTLNDNLKQTGQNLGVWTLPALTEATSLMNFFAAAAQAASGKLAGLRGTADSTFETIMDTVGAPEWADPFGDPVESVEHFRDTVTGAFDDISRVVAGEPITWAAKMTQSFGDLGDQVQTAVDTALLGLHTDALITVQTHLSTIVDREQFLDDLRAQLRGEDAISLPARLVLTAEGISKLGPRQLAFIESVGSEFSRVVQDGLAQGLSEAKIGRNLDALAAQLRPILIDANIDPKVVDRILGRLSGEAIIDVEADTKPAEKDVDKFVQRKTGKTITVDANTKNARDKINDLTKTETKYIDIIVRKVDAILPNFGGGGRAAPQLAPVGGPSLLAAGTTLAAPAPLPFTTGGGVQTVRMAPPPAEPRREVLRPKQTPVAVYLDGTEIGNRLDLRRSLAAVESVRRTA